MGGAPSSFPITSQNERVDENSKKVITLFARNLRIAFSDDKRFWLWRRPDDLQAVSNKAIDDVAELLDSCWLDVRGKFEVAKLSPGTQYELVFTVKLKDSAYGWEAPVNVRLTVPEGYKIESKENLMEKPRGVWIEIPVGLYETSKEKTEAGEIKLSVYKYGWAWKSGLVIKGITIRPRNEF